MRLLKGMRPHRLRVVVAVAVAVAVAVSDAVVAVVNRAGLRARAAVDL
jgi:alpha-mannosidase